MPDAGAIEAVVFDLGGVLIDWNPRHLYRQLFDDEAAMEAFLAEVTTPEWNTEQDRGRDWNEAIELLVAAYPDKRDLIVAYLERWPEMLGGSIDGTVQIVHELQEHRPDLRLLVLSNWSTETFPVARARYPFLEWFEGVLISGDLGAIKPEAEAFDALISRFGLHADRTVFVDDSAANVDAARRHGLIAIRFEGPEHLRRSLAGLGLPGPAGPSAPG